MVDHEVEKIVDKLQKLRACARLASASDSWSGS